MGFKVRDIGDVMKEVPGDEFFLWDPECFSAVVNNCVLVQVAIDDGGAGRSSKEVGEEVGYKRLLE